MKLLLTIGALAMTVSAYAGTVTTTVKPPSKYTNGAAIDAPITYRLEGNYDGQLTITVLSDSPTFVLLSMAPGHWCNRVVAIVNNVDADPSDQACVTVTQPNQPPPAVKKPNPAYGISTTASP